MPVFRNKLVIIDDDDAREVSDGGEISDVAVQRLIASIPENIDQLELQLSGESGAFILSLLQRLQTRLPPLQKISFNGCAFDGVEFTAQLALLRAIPASVQDIALDLYPWAFLDAMQLQEFFTALSKPTLKRLSLADREDFDYVQPGMCCFTSVEFAQALACLSNELEEIYLPGQNMAMLLDRNDTWYAGDEGEPPLRDIPGLTNCLVALIKPNSKIIDLNDNKLCYLATDSLLVVLNALKQAAKKQAKVKFIGLLNDIFLPEGQIRSADETVRILDALPPCAVKVLDFNLIFGHLSVAEQKLVLKHIPNYIERIFLEHPITQIPEGAGWHISSDGKYLIKTEAHLKYVWQQSPASSALFAGPVMDKFYTYLSTTDITAMNSATADILFDRAVNYFIGKHFIRTLDRLQSLDEVGEIKRLISASGIEENPADYYRLSSYNITPLQQQELAATLQAGFPNLSAEDINLKLQSIFGLKDDEYHIAKFYHTHRIGQLLDRRAAMIKRSEDQRGVSLSEHLPKRRR